MGHADNPLSHLQPRHGFGGDAVRLGELVMKRAEAALAPLGLTPLGYDLLLCIRASEGPSQQELSRVLNLYAQKMVGLIDGLEKQGLVERKVSPTDRRRHMLHLTTAGDAMLDRAIVIGAALEADLFGEVSEDDRARFHALVEALEARTAADC